MDKNTKNLNGWICTDPDNAQYTKRLNDFKFSFMEARKVTWLGDDSDDHMVCYADVDLRLIPLNKLWKYLSGYYESFEQIISCYGLRDALRVMAECVFEQCDPDCLDNYVRPETGVLHATWFAVRPSFEEAEEYILDCIKRFG